MATPNDESNIQNETVESAYSTSEMTDDQLIEAYMQNHFDRRASDNGYIDEAKPGTFETNENALRTALLERQYTSDMIDSETSMRMQMWQEMPAEELSDTQKHILSTAEMIGDSQVIQKDAIQQQNAAQNDVVQNDVASSDIVQDATPEHSKPERLKEMLTGFKSPTDLSVSEMGQRLGWDALAAFGLKTVANRMGANNAISWVVGLGGAAALRGLNVLPKSFAPVVNWVKDHFSKEGSKVNQGLDKAATFLGGVTDEQKAQADLNANKYTYLKDSVDEMSGLVAGAPVESLDALRSQMRENGKVVAEKGVLLEVGKEGLDACEGVRGVTQLSIAGAMDSFDQRAAAGEDVTEDMRSYYKGMLSGLEAYGAGAEDAIYSTYTDAGSRNKAIEGLSDINCAYADEVMNALKDADAQYGFMTTKDWIEIDSMNIKGVGTLSEYEPGYLDARHGDNYSMYADAGLEDASVQSSNANLAKGVSGDTQTAEQLSTRSNRVAAAEQMQDRVLADSSAEYAVEDGYGHNGGGASF